MSILIGITTNIWCWCIQLAPGHLWSSQIVYFRKWATPQKSIWLWDDAWTGVVDELHHFWCSHFGWVHQLFQSAQYYRHKYLASTLMMTTHLYVWRHSVISVENWSEQFTGDWNVDKLLYTENFFLFCLIFNVISCSLKMKKIYIWGLIFDLLTKLIVIFFEKLVSDLCKKFCSLPNWTMFRNFKKIWGLIVFYSADLIQHLKFKKN